MSSAPTPNRVPIKRHRLRKRSVCGAFLLFYLLFQNHSNSARNSSALPTALNPSQWGGIKRRVSGAKKRSSISSTTPLSSGVRMTRAGGLQDLVHAGEAVSIVKPGAARLLKVGAQLLLPGTDLRQTGADDRLRRSAAPRSGLRPRQTRRPALQSPAGYCPGAAVNCARKSARLASSMAVFLPAGSVRLRVSGARTPPAPAPDSCNWGRTPGNARRGHTAISSSRRGDLWHTLSARSL